MAPFIGELSAQLTERLPLATLGDDPYDGVMKKEAAREAMLRGTTSFSSVLANELPTFADTGSFACKTTEVVQFCTTAFTVTYPTSKKDKYQAIIAHMSRSFMPNVQM